MGATPYSNEKKQYFNIQGFQFTVRAEEGAEGAKMRTIAKKDKTTKDVWEYLFRDISGHIKSIEIKESKFGKQYEIVIQDVADNMVIQIQTASGYADSLIARLSNIDPSLPVKLVPYSFIPEGKTKKKEGVNIYQNDTKVDPAFTRENPNGQPQPQHPNAEMDEDEWKIYFMQLRKFYSKVAIEFNEKLKAGAFAKNQESDSQNTDNLSLSDDLPFAWILVSSLFSLAMMA